MGALPIVCVKVDPNDANEPGYVRWGWPYTEFEPFDPPGIAPPSAIRAVLDEIVRLRSPGAATVFRCTTLFQDQNNRAVAQRLRNYAILLAGHHAQEIEDPDGDHDNYWGDLKDIDQIKRDLFGFNEPPQVRECSETCRAVATDALRAHWAAVQRLAERLTHTTLLSGADAIAVIDGS